MSIVDVLIAIPLDTAPACGGPVVLPWGRWFPGKIPKSILGPALRVLVSRPVDSASDSLLAVTPHQPSEYSWAALTLSQWQRASETLLMYRASVLVRFANRQWGDFLANRTINLNDGHLCLQFTTVHRGEKFNRCWSVTITLAHRFLFG